MGGRTNTANRFLRMLAGWAVAAGQFLGGFTLTGICIAAAVTGLFVLQYLCLSLFRHVERKRGRDAVRECQ
jgi:hypothetical protein